MFKTKKIENELEEVFEGINIAANVIKSTMGAKGKSVILYDDKDIRFTKDGVTVAKSIVLENPIQNVGAKLVINSADKTVSNVGDGTTATSVMLQAFVNSYRKLLSTRQEIDINTLLRHLTAFLSDVTTILDEGSRKVEKVSQIASIASISANSKELGELIAEIYEQTGFDSYIGLEKNYILGNTEYVVEKGIDYDSPYVSVGFINQDNKTCEFENAYVYMTTDNVKFIDQYDELLNEAIETKTPLVMIAPYFSTQFIKTALTNKQRSNLKICLIKTPGYGRDIEDNIKDIQSYLTDGTYCKKIVITDSNFVIYNDESNTVDTRVKKLKKEFEGVTNDYDRDRLLERIHKLQGSIATIFVGGETVKEMEETYDRLEDALGAVRAAIRHGFSVGGGLSLFNIARRLKYSKDMMYAAAIVKDVLNAPIKTIISNGNYVEREIVQKLDDAKDNYGFNVITGEIENMHNSGIIDPTEVIKQSLTNSFSSFKLLINTEYILHNVI